MPGAQVMPVPIRPMVLLGPEHSCWGGGELPSVASAIVWADPPASVTEVDADRMREALYAAGAVSVRITLAKQATQAPSRALAEEGPKGNLEVALALIASMRSRDPARLERIVRQALEEGQRKAKRALVPSAGPSLTIASIQLLNWIRYRGEHVLRFGEQVYGIIAQHADDEERSNWLGKTSLLEAIEFALYGEHRWDREDDWITYGEPAGAVELTLSDGSVIERTRKRGASTQLRAAIATAGGSESKVATQAAGQKAIEELIGLSKEDFRATCCFRQKELARLVLARPAERFRLIEGWLELGPLRAAEQVVRDELGAELEDQEREVRAGEEARRRAREIVQEVGLDPEMQFEAARAELDVRFEAVGELLGEARHRMAQLTDAKAAAEHRARDQAEAKQHDDARRRLAEARKQAEIWDRKRLEAQRGELATAADGARLAAQRAIQEAEGKRVLARGQFDGRCPVSARACPVTDEINAARKENAGLLSFAEEVRESTRKASATAAADLAECEAKLRDLAAAEMRVQLLEAEVTRTRGGWERSQGAGGIAGDPADLEACWNEAQRLGAQQERLRRALSELEKSEKTIEESGARAAESSNAVGSLREALRIVGRGGAQKVIAVGVLAEIESEANGVLGESGIDLRVELRWGREASGTLASECAECGAPFSASRKVKVCTLCGAERGPKVEDRIDLVLSDRSGAAEDLAGIAVQLAAGAWLRRKRGARWSTVLVDEPFGALDGAHRRALAGQLATLLRGRRGYRQGFVIAHSTGAMDALGGRILVKGQRDGTSSVEVCG
jgi:hypothetical protein